MTIIQVISGCREEGDTDGDYHYLVADMEHMESSKILIQVIEAANRRR